MNVTARIDLSHAFVLRPADVAKIWSAFSESIGPVKATARCTDNIEREFNSADELTSYENARPRAIRSLTIRARSKDWDTSALLHVGSRLSTTIELNLEGPESRVLLVRDRLGELFAEIRPWYSMVTRIDFFVVVWAVMAFFVLVLTAMGSGAKSERTLTFPEAVKAAAILVVFLGAIGALIAGINRLRDRFFPVVTFALGRGQDRYEFDEKIRWVVIIGFLVSAFASLVVAFLITGA